VFPSTYMDVCRGQLFRGGQVFLLTVAFRRNSLERHGTSRERPSEPWHAGVISSSGKPVFAKQNFSPRPSRGFTAFCLLLGFALLLLPAPLRAESLEDAAHELAMKVCLAAHKQPVKVAWQESPPSSGYLSDARKKVFLDQISACGMVPAENSDAPALMVTMQVTASRALLIAYWTDTTAGRQTYMVEIPRAALFVARETSPEPQLQRELLWQQEKPIQSAMEWQDGGTQERYLFLLSDGLFIRCRFENGVWKAIDSADLPASGRRSRSGDESIFYSHAKDKIELIVHNKICDFTNSGRISFSCAGSDPGEKAAELSSTCQESHRYLSSGKGDYTQLDRIISKRATGSGTVASPEESYSSSVDMPGPVLDISMTENSKAASAVVKNLSTGNYEVYRITAVCND